MLRYYVGCWNIYFDINDGNKQHLENTNESVITPFLNAIKFWFEIIIKLLQICQIKENDLNYVRL